MKLSKIVIAGTAVLATCGALGLAPAAAQASPATTPTWTRQAPAAHPSARWGQAVAYDAAAGNVVLFGGVNGPAKYSDTWTWNGSTWARQAPAVHPPITVYAATAYDAATGTVVMFGGAAGKFEANTKATWTWNGSTWAKQHPAASPSARVSAAMVYDPATGNVVLFGGGGNSTFNDTWTWNGSTWTKRHPATSPSVRTSAQMVYDPATGNVVLFGGQAGGTSLGDTWTWNGTTWTQQNPAASPPTTYGGAMDYDAATGNVVLFGGAGGPDGTTSNDGTWTWDGTTWTQQNPATSPPFLLYPTLTYDPATSQNVLFGGFNNTKAYSSTWLWG
jgi:hypothetical protein